MRIIVIGTGNYVTGRGTEGHGTILPAIYEFNKINKIDEVIILATSKRSKELARIKNRQIAKLSGQNLKVNIVTKIPKDLNSSKNKISCAIIATPDHTHYKLIKKYLKKGLHCLVVKPVVTKLSRISQKI